MKNSQNYMLIFRFEPDFSYQPSEAELAEQNQQWGAYIGNLAISEKLVETHHLGFNGKQVNADKNVSEGISISSNKTVGGNMVVRANGIDEAVEIAKGSPILHIGGTVEVRDILAM